MSKKFFIPLIILAVVLAAGLGIFIASNQSAQTPTAAAPEQKNELNIQEINRTINIPRELGKTTHQASNDSILFYSEKYEKLAGCAGHPLGELKLSNTQSENALQVGGQYAYAVFIPHPLGQCSKEEGQQLATSLATALNNAQ